MPPVLKDVTIQYGEVSYRNEIPASPATSETTGNVTVNMQATPGLPAHYKVDFRISATYTGESLETDNYLHWTVLVTGLGPEASYSEIESSASAKVAPMLRLLAEDLEAKEAAAHGNRQRD